MATRQVAYRLYIAWNLVDFVEETSRLMSATGELRIVPPGDSFTSGRGIIPSMTLVLDNNDGRYSPMNTFSAIYSYIVDGKAYHAPCYLEVSVNTGYNRVFTGVIKWPDLTGGTTKAGSTITIECRGKEELLLQERTSSTQYSFAGYYDLGYNEAEIIDAWLTDASVSGGDISVGAGLFVIPWAWKDDESPIEEIWKLAAACGGRFYTTPDGVFTYESATRWITNARSVTSQETIDTDDFATFEPTYDDKDLYSSVLVEASPRDILAPDTLWEPDEVVSVLPARTKILTARLRQPAYTINAVEYSAATAGGTNITSNVSVTSVNFAQRVDITIVNTHATHAAYLRPFRITGRAVSGAATIEEERNATDSGSNAAFFSGRGDRRKSIRGNVYIQSRAHAAAVAEFLMRQSEYPRLTYKVSGASGKSTRKLGDKVTLNDTTLMSASRTALITGIRWRLNHGSGFYQDLELIDAANLYPYLGASPGYFLIGTSKLGAADAARGRLFF